MILLTLRMGKSLNAPVSKNAQLHFDGTGETNDVFLMVGDGYKKVDDSNVVVGEEAALKRALSMVTEVSPLSVALEDGVRKAFAMLREDFGEFVRRDIWIYLRNIVVYVPGKKDLTIHVYHECITNKDYKNALFIMTLTDRPENG